MPTVATIARGIARYYDVRLASQSPAHLSLVLQASDRMRMAFELGDGRAYSPAERAARFPSYCATLAREVYSERAAIRRVSFRLN